MRWGIAGLLVIAGAAVGIACGGGSKDATPSPAAVGTPQPTMATPGPISGNQTVVIGGTAGPTRTPTPFSVEQQTAVALGPNVPLVPFEDPEGRYTVSIPRGWTVAVNTHSFSATLGGRPVAAVVGIFCAPDGNVDDMIASDQNTQQQIGAGNLTLDRQAATQVDGVTAREVPWSGHFDLLDVTIDHDWVYFEAKGCAWRIVLNTYPPAKIDDYMPMFRQMLASFKLK